MITEILLCAYVQYCVQEPNQCNIEVSNKHRIGWPKVDIENTTNGDCSIQELDVT